MANKWQLNEARQIAYFDSNGNRHDASAVWYIGKYGTYKVWPGSIYLTNVKIEGGGKVLDYTIDNNGTPSYTYNGTVYSGLSPNTDYTIKGTIVVYQLKDGSNVQMASYDECYPWHLTTQDWSGGDKYGPIWTASNGTSTKPNPILPEGDEYKNWAYNTYNCDPEMATSDSDDNVWYSPHMGFITKWPGDNNGFTTIAKLGESDYGIRLKRTPISRGFTVDLGHPTLGIGESATGTCTYNTSWGGPNPGSKSSTNFTITNDNSDIFSVTNSGSTFTITCLKPTSGTYTYTITANSYGKTDTLNKMVTIVGPSYRLQAATGSSVVNPGSTMTISTDKTIVVYKATSYEDIYNNNYTELTNFTLSSSNTSIVGISNKTLKPYKSGTATITVTDNDLNTSFTFTCEVEIEDTPTFMEVSVGNTSVGTYAFPDANIIAITRSHIGSQTQYIPITIRFKTASSGGLSKELYHVKVSGSPYSYAPGTSNTMSITMSDTTSQVMTFDIYKSQGGEKLGTLTIDYL